MVLNNNDRYCNALKMKEKNTEKKIIDALKKSEDGATITELIKLSNLSRSTVRVALARLEGQENVRYRNVGMAKVYVLGGAK